MRSLIYNSKFRILFSVIAGAVIGYAYYYFIGCYSGTCPISSSWYVSTIYGGLVGLLISTPNKRSK
jgi:uncharacterized membrane protein YjjB (DUF3815 family)